MQDAVAEVLLERRALVPRRIPPIIASAMVHFLLVAAALLVSRSRAELTPRTHVLNIRLAPPAAPPITLAPPVASPEEKPAPVPAPAVEKPKPVEKKETKKPVEKALFGKSPEKPAEAPPRPMLPETAAVPVTRTAAPGTGVAALEGGDFPYTIYIDRMLTLIGGHWLRPQSEAELTTQVYFVIERDGRLRDVKIEKSSGSSAFDRAALRAVLETSPLPPLPFAYSGTHLGVHLTFH